MLDSLKIILKIQELDMKMIRLMRLKRDRQKELAQIYSLREDLEKQLKRKGEEVTELKKDIRIQEGLVQEIASNITRLEGQQNKVKKVDEFNALSQELNTAERSRANTEKKVGELGEKLIEEEGLLASLQETLKTTEESSRALEDEIKESIERINGEGRGIQVERDALVAETDPEIFRVYERLLKNKKDRVVVPIEDRACSGCHIMLTAQHENLVRKGERLVFCEHCARIHFWQEAEDLVDSVVATKRRRRRSTAV